MSKFLQRLLAGRSLVGSQAPPVAPVLEIERFQGYVDERSTHHVRGWVRSLADPGRRVRYQVVLTGPEGERILADGIAGDFSPVLEELRVGDATYAFLAYFPELLTAEERDRVIVRPLGGPPLEFAPRLVTRPPSAQVPRICGFVDQRSIRHVAGWIWNEADPAERVPYEIVLVSGEEERALATGIADRFSPVLSKLGVGEASYAFEAFFPAPLTETERDHIVARSVETRQPLPFAPALEIKFEPISHVAMDIVNNCNLRCPFCVYDYGGTRTTHFMSPATFDAALRLIPYVTTGNFWLSCLHEPTLHPDLWRFIDRVPREYRHKLMFTTNLAKRMPDEYFARLAGSGIHHINISIESLDPAIYERMRKGARWSIFRENWEKLLRACETGAAPPRLRYNIMAYRSNLAEIPRLTEILRAEKRAWQVEIRHTFDVCHIPQSFRDAEYLDSRGWTWLAQQLRDHNPTQVLLLPPAEAGSAGPEPEIGGQPEGDPPSAPMTPSLPLQIRIDWDGSLQVYGESPGVGGAPPQHTNFVTSNITYPRDPVAFLMALVTEPAQP